MVHTRNQQGGDCSPAVSGRLTTTTGGPVPATRSSVTATQVTAAGDLITTGSKLTSNGTPFTKMAALVSEYSQISVGTHSRVGPSVSSETTSAHTRVSPCIVDLCPYGDASANAFAISERETGFFPFSERETGFFPFSERERPHGTALLGATKFRAQLPRGIQARNHGIYSPLRPRCP